MCLVFIVDRIVQKCWVDLCMVDNMKEGIELLNYRVRLRNCHIVTLGEIGTA